MPIPTQKERVGTTVGGRYALGEILGVGGMGTVYAAKHALTGSAAAVKLLNSNCATQPLWVERFFAEARASVTLQHPHIVRVLDMGHDDEYTVWLALELLEGETLRERMTRVGRLDSQTACDLVHPIALALGYAHERGFLHRDIKPANIFLSVDAMGTLVPKLLDFGVAKAFDLGASGITRTGDLVGTPTYMSPEQARAARQLTPASDVWAMGVLLYELLMGSCPFNEEQLVAQLQLIQDGLLPSDWRAQSGASSKLCDLIQSCLEKDARERPPTGMHVAKWLVEASSAPRTVPPSALVEDEDTLRHLAEPGGELPIAKTVVLASPGHDSAPSSQAAPQRDLHLAPAELTVPEDSPPSRRLPVGLLVAVGAVAVLGLAGFAAASFWGPSEALVDTTVESSSALEREEREATAVAAPEVAPPDQTQQEQELRPDQEAVISAEPEAIALDALPEPAEPEPTAEAEDEPAADTQMQRLRPRPRPRPPAVRPPAVRPPPQQQTGLAREF